MKKQDPWYLPPEPQKDGVIRRWVRERCTFRMQAVLLAAVRGCDGAPKDDPSKPVLWALRFDCLNPSYDGGDLDPHNFSAFMGYRKDLNPSCRQFLKSLDQYPFHFVMHFTHAAEIIGAFHPDEVRRMWWWGIYCSIVHENLHCLPETTEGLNKRLADR